MHRPAAERLEAAAASLLQQLRGLLRQLAMRLSNVVDIPVSDRRGIGRQLRLARRIKIEGHDLGLVFLSVGARDHREIVEVAAENRLRNLRGARLRCVPGHVAEKGGADQKYGKHSFHKQSSVREILKTEILLMRTKAKFDSRYFLGAGFADSNRIS